MQELAQESVKESRRRHQRMRLNAQVGIQFKGWASTVAQCLDVSRGGLRIRLRDRVRIGDQIIFQASVPGADDFQLQAEVRHVQRTSDGHYEAGLCWLTKDDRGAIVFNAMSFDL